MSELQVGAMLFLLWNSIVDIHKKQISLKAVFVFTVLRLVYFLLHMADAESGWSADVGTLLAGLIPGLLLCILAKISRGALGYGDGIVVMTAGLYLGFMSTTIMVMWAFFSAFFWSVGMLIMKKCKTNTRFPFVPFLLIGLLIDIWI